jgi:hypothetical protein
MVSPSTFSLSVFWAGAAMCAVAETAVIHRAMSRPSAESPTAGVDTAGTGAVGGIRLRGRGTAGEVIWALIPAIILGLVFYWTWAEIHRAPPSTLPDRLNPPAARGTNTRGTVT